MKAPVHQRGQCAVALRTLARALVAMCVALALPVNAGGLLWRVEGGAAPAYLLGSLHFGADDMYPLHPRIEQAMGEAERVMVEVNLLEIDPPRLATAILARGAQPPGQELRDQVTESLWQALFQLSRRLGFPVATFAQQQPWLAAITLGSISVLELGLDESRGVDRHVMQRLQGKVPILELESLDSQLRLLSDIPLTEQVAMLDATVRGYEEGQALMQKILGAWRSGDGELLQRLVAEDAALGSHTAAGLKARFLDQRNRDMSRRIVEQLQRPGSVLVVVGAAHLVGSESIVERLQRQGYSVRQLATGP